jgi:thiamine biosynthesis lipoprotein
VKQQSNGAFDVALGTGEILLGRSERTVAFDRPGVCIDLGGIAKGHALDRAADILREGGVESALLHGGTSSVLAIGAPPDARAWRVALAHSDGQPCIELCDRALSVSRPYSQLVDDRSHIVDARSRDRVLRPCTAAVVGPSASMTDAWSTALAVLGRRPEGLGEEWTTYIEFERD